MEEKSGHELVSANFSMSMLSCLRKIGIKKFLMILFVESKGLKIFLTNFLLSYNLRAGISLLIRLLTIIRQDPKSAFSLKALLNETDFHFREEAVRTGLMVGLFTGIYKAITFTLARINFLRCYNYELIEQKSKSLMHPKRKRPSIILQKEKWHSAVAGFLAGFSILIMDESWHRTLALYMSTRLIQCWYNYNKMHGYFHFWGSSWPHGDSLLFAVASAQIMYAYVMRPETLPHSYYKFIVNQGPINETILDAVRKSCRDQPVDVKKVLNFIYKKGGRSTVTKVLPFFFKNVEETSVREKLKNLAGTNYVETLLQNLEVKEQIKLVPLQALHPYTANTLLHTFNAWKRVAKQIFPVYLALALVPAAVLRFGSFLKRPVAIILRSTLGAIQSTMFLSLFCAIYQFVINIHRWIAERGYKSTSAIQDSKFVYWLAGFISSSTILLEKKNRRSELALYALPRAADSMFLILTHHNLITGLHNGEILLFCAAMSGIMFFYEHYPDLLSPLVSKLMDRFLNNNVVFRRHDLEYLHIESNFSELDLHDLEVRLIEKARQARAASEFEEEPKFLENRVAKPHALEEKTASGDESESTFDMKHSPSQVTLSGSVLIQ